MEGAADNSRNMSRISNRCTIGKHYMTKIADLDGLHHCLNNRKDLHRFVCGGG